MQTMISHDSTMTSDDDHLVLSRRAEFLMLGRRIDVLVIDDDPFFLKLLQAALPAPMFKLDCFESLPAAETVSRLGRYDLAVLDYYLPRMNGVEIAEYVGAFLKDVPVILISGGRLPGDPQMVWPACIRKYVSKTDGIRVLVDAIVEVVADLKKSADE